MFDSIAIRKELKDDSFEKINKEKLTYNGEGVNHHTGELYSKYRLRNLYVNLSNSGISISGSLPQYISDSNFAPLPFCLAKAAIKKLELDLNISLGNAELTRLDITNNLLLNNPIQNYLQYFGEVKKFRKKHDYNNRKGLIYSSCSTGLEFYDKRTKPKKTDPDLIPLKFKNNKTAFRFECQLKDNLEKRFGLKNGEKVTVEMLYKPWFAQRAINIWHDYFYEIPKLNELPSDVYIDLETSTKDLDTYLILKSLTPEVLSNLNGKIDSLTNNKNVVKTDRYLEYKKRNLRDHVRNLIQRSNNNYPIITLLEEINQEVEDITCFWKDVYTHIQGFNSSKSGHLYIS